MQTIRRITIVIDAGGEAFVDNPEAEIVRVLDDIGQLILNENILHVVDSNGETCGSVDVRYVEYEGD